jgi:hypothetical protein
MCTKWKPIQLSPLQSHTEEKNTHFLARSNCLATAVVLVISRSTTGTERKDKDLQFEIFTLET